MELVEVTPIVVERRARAVVVPWKALAAQQSRTRRTFRVLVPGERVVLAMDGVLRSGRVHGNADVAGEGCYVLSIGPVIARNRAQRRTGRPLGSPPAPRAPRTTTRDPDVEVIDLLDAILAQEARRRSVDVLL